MKKGRIVRGNVQLASMQIDIKLSVGVKEIEIDFDLFLTPGLLQSCSYVLF